MRAASRMLRQVIGAGSVARAATCSRRDAVAIACGIALSRRSNSGPTTFVVACVTISRAYGPSASEDESVICPMNGRRRHEPKEEAA